MTKSEQPRPRRDHTLVARVVSAAVVAMAVGGLVATGIPSQQSADAAVAAGSELTVAWVGDNSLASGFQPDRDTSSPHFADFDKLSVTVSKTTGIVDQAIRVRVSGFAGTKSNIDFGTNAQNFMQAMQCWGEDPLADDFVQTCQWGGRYAANNGVGNSVYFDSTLRVAPIDADPSRTTSFDNPFVTVDGAEVSGKPFLQDPDGVGPQQAEAKYPILDFFSPSTTNEVASARIGSDGTGFFDFETQSADQAPQLGCGTPEHLRCWLVIVPRGTHFGGDGAACSSFLDSRIDYRPYTYGRPDSFQGGSPVNPNCDYWDNRINIPLEFTPVGTTCKVGGAEERVIGSQLMVGAMSSWQPALCDNLETTFSFSTNPDAIARAQVLEGDAILGYSGFPASSGELQTEDERKLLASTDLSYTPVAISSVVVSFIAEFDSGRAEQLTLSPRLMAKLLTQSYRFQVPTSTTDDPAKNYAHLPAKNLTYRFLNQDPEFQALNPNYAAFSQNPALILPGPSGADAIRQVWRWIQADAKAVAFLNGEADEWGMSINPYYLPKGNPKAVVPQFIDATGAYVAAGTGVNKEVGLTNLDGTPQQLALTPIDTFPKNDESLAPLNKTVERSRFDSIQFSPYTDNILTAARATFRADPNSKTVWDQTKINAGGEVGDWVSSGAQIPGQKFTISITDSPSAIRYGLNVASLVLPNSADARQPTIKAMTDALDALTPTSLDSILQVDPSRVGSGYPLTMITYAQVNLSESTAAERTRIAAMLKQVTTTGQVSGSARGELPEGYLPLTASLTAQAAASIGGISAYAPRTSTTTTTTPTSTSNGIAQDPYELDTQATATTDAAATGQDPTTTAGLDELDARRTASTSSEWVGRTALALALAIGLAGFLIAPALFRGRRYR